MQGMRGASICHHNRHQRRDTAKNAGQTIEEEEDEEEEEFEFHSQRKLQTRRMI
jgi:hypothetical protein